MNPNAPSRDRLISLAGQPVPSNSKQFQAIPSNSNQFQPSLPERRFGGEPLHDLTIGGGKLVPGNLVAHHPAKIRTAKLLRFMTGPFAAIELKHNGLLGIAMPDRLDQLADFDFNADFFAQFSAQALHKAFLRLPFATGKFPESS